MSCGGGHWVCFKACFNESFVGNPIFNPPSFFRLTFHVLEIKKTAARRLLFLTAVLFCTEMGLEFIWLAPARQAHTAYRVPGVGLEPTRPNGHRILSPACLPIPPHGQMMYLVFGLAIIVSTTSLSLQCLIIDTTNLSKKMGLSRGWCIKKHQFPNSNPY